VIRQNFLGTPNIVNLTHLMSSGKIFQKNAKFS